MLRYFNLIKSFSNWFSYFKYKLLGIPRDADHIVFLTRNGVKIEVPKRIMHDFKDVFLAESYAGGMPRPVATHSDIIDIGANIGSFTFFAASRFPGARIFAFEPDPHNFRQLQKNAALNPGRTEVNHMAVAGISGEVKLFGGCSNEHSTGASIAQDENASGGYAVAATSLEDLFAKCSIERCGLLKMDCEGAEFQILYAAPQSVLDRIDQMILEVHSTEQDGSQSFAGLRQFLQDRGFKTKCKRSALLWAWH